MNVLEILADYLVEHAPPGSRPYKHNYCGHHSTWATVSSVSYWFGTAFIYGTGKVLLVSSGVEYFQGDLADPDLVDALQKAVEDTHELCQRSEDDITHIKKLFRNIEGSP